MDAPLMFRPDEPRPDLIVDPHPFTGRETALLIAADLFAFLALVFFCRWCFA